MRVLIADDEPLALRRLTTALACVPEAEVVGVAETGDQALRLLQELQPELVVLDVHMPGPDGFDVAARLRRLLPSAEVIFVTGMEQHAIRAFDLGAADYVLKPVSFERLREAVRRAGARLQARSADARFAELERRLEALAARDGPDGRGYDREIWARDSQGLSRVPVEDIDRIEADGDYVIAHVGQATHLMHETLRSLEQRLDPAQFLRVHRSTIVNASRIRALRRRPNSKLRLTLSDGSAVEVGPSFTESVLKAVNARRWR
jgi:DNA-binding LytR/AlgR family response regulator